MTTATLRGVCFDLWETLVSDPPGTGERRAADRAVRALAVLSEAGLPHDRAEVDAAIQRTIDALVAIHQGNLDITAADRVALFGRQLDPVLDIDGDLPPRARDGLTAALLGATERHAPALLPGAVEALQALRAAGLPLALVSNTGLSPGPVLRRTLETLGIRACFDVQVFSDELCAWKPHAAMFRAAADGLGLSPAELAFVGDTPESDILGARASGFAFTVLVGDKPSDGVEPHLRLAGVHALVSALHARGLLTGPD